MRGLAVVLGMLVLFTSGVAYGNARRAAVPLADPILRIETGMHTAAIKGMDIDRAERLLVTGSGDKTVRLWELQTGKLLRTLRLPIGSGNEGKIYAVAISPDGRTVAAGGWTGYDRDKSHSIYIFDSDSGALSGRISGLSSRIAHLAFSPNGKRLVASLKGGGASLPQW